MSRYIICYDICDEGRLRKLSRALEREAMRVQYSVFLIEAASTRELCGIKEIIAKYINKSDDVRIYKAKSDGMALGQGVEIDEAWRV